MSIAKELLEMLGYKKLTKDDWDRIRHNRSLLPDKLKDARAMAGKDMSLNKTEKDKKQIELSKEITRLGARTPRQNMIISAQKKRLG